MDFIVLLKYIVLGLVQGFTEPIPVSSSGHIFIINELFLNMDDVGLTFAILTNTASLLAILIIFREDIIRLITNSFGYISTGKPRYKSDFKFSLFVIIGSIPAGILGVLFSDVIDEYLTSMTTIAITLFLTGVALWLIRNLRGVKRDGDLTYKDALVVGFAQAIALIPGISRSGATVISSIAVGMKQETALRFSFMLYIPVSLGGVILGISDFINEPPTSDLYVPYIAAFIVTFFVTYFAMKWFIGIMKHGKLQYFAYYCFAMSIFLFFYF